VLDPASAKPDEKKQTFFYDIRTLGLEGQGWTDVKNPFDRLPAKAEGVVRPAVWNLSHDSAGLCVRFVTDAPSISARWALNQANLALPHMAATGVSGVDLYARTRPGDPWRFAACGQPKAFPENETLYTAPSSASGTREYLLYLPLYNGVTSVSVGVEAGRSLEVLPPRPRGIIVYGTSITQGACASRPGMAWTAQVGRKLDRPVVNLGFSGSGKMEPALADLLAELDPELFVLDCLRNMSEAEVAARVEPFVRRLRQSRRTTPIVLLQDVFTDDPKDTPRGKLVRQAVERLTKAGVPNVFYVPLRGAWGTDGEATVDNIHPTDLGMTRQADAVSAALRRHLFR
jgi:lysophospholipase L1-like esterase